MQKPKLKFKGVKTPKLIRQGAVRYFVKLQPSESKNKKYDAIIHTPDMVAIKTVPFGDSRYSDFTIHKDKKRKSLYIDRHSKNEDWSNPFTAGFWSRWILWNMDNIEDSKTTLNAIGIYFV